MNRWDGRGVLLPGDERSSCFIEVNCLIWFTTSATFLLAVLHDGVPSNSEPSRPPHWMRWVTFDEWNENLMLLPTCLLFGGTLALSIRGSPGATS